MEEELICPNCKTVLGCFVGICKCQCGWIGYWYNTDSRYYSDGIEVIFN